MLDDGLRGIRMREREERRGIYTVLERGKEENAWLIWGILGVLGEPRVMN